MKLMFTLSGENPDLGIGEVKALGSAKNEEKDGNIYLADCNDFEFQRLAFVHKICGFLFSCSRKELKGMLEKVPWELCYKGDFCVRVKDLDEKETELAEIIWGRLKKPKVRLNKSSMQVEILGSGKKVYCGILLHENLEQFFNRRPHLRPGFHPSSINPKLARACVNLTRAKKGQVLLDPFCGTGGLLLEAAMMGMKVKGCDIDPRMVSLAKKNFEFFKFKDYELQQCDATTVKMDADAFVTDPPYGRSASLHKSDKVVLYEAVLENAYRQMKLGQIFVFIAPQEVKFNTKLKVVTSIDHYVHSSLTRRIYILQR